MKSSGTSVTFHIMDETTYKQAKAKGVNLSEPQNKANVVANGVAKGEQKPKLCYLVKSASGFEFSLFSSNGELRINNFVCESSVKLEHQFTHGLTGDSKLLLSVHVSLSAARIGSSSPERSSAGLEDAPMDR